MKRGKKRLIIVTGIIASLIGIIAVIITMFSTQITELFNNTSNDGYLAYNGKKYVSIRATNTGASKEVDKIYLREGYYSDPDTSNTGWCLMKNAGIYGIADSSGKNCSVISDRKDAYSYMDYARSGKSGSLKWLYDNMIRLGNDKNENEIYKKNMEELTGLNLGGYTYDQIFRIEQYVIWSFTHNNNAFDNGINFPTDKLYSQLKKKANENSNYKGNGSANKIEVDKNDAIVTEDGLIGPIRISGNNAKNKISISNIQKYQYKFYKDKECKNEINDFQTYEGTFYIKLLNTTFKENTRYIISFDFKNDSYKTSAYCYITEKDVYDACPPQPFLMIERNLESSNIDLDFEYYKEIEEGKYNIRLSKESTTGEGTGTANFNVKSNVGQEKNLTLTVNRGITSLYGNVKIDNTESDEYIIKETGASENYEIGVNKPVKIVVHKEVKDSKYKYKSLDIYIDNQKVATDVSSGWAMGNIKINVDFGENVYINVIYKNPPIGKYNMSIVKKSAESTTEYDDYSDALDGASFEIQQQVNGFEGNTFTVDSVKGNKQTIADTKITDIKEYDTYLIKETKAPEGYKLNNTYLELRIRKDMNAEKSMYCINGVYLYIIQEDGTKLSQGWIKNSYINESLGIEINYDEANIQVTYKDSIIPGKYNLSIAKKSTKSDTNLTDYSDALANASYEITDTLKSDYNGIRITTEAGKKTDIYQDGVKINNLNEADVYYIKEVESPDGYKLNNGKYDSIMEFSCLKLRVYKQLNENKDKIIIKNVSIDYVYSNGVTNLGEKIEKGKEHDCQYATIGIYYTDTDIQVIYKNEPYRYKLELQKVKEDVTNAPLPQTKLSIGNSFNHTSNITLSQEEAKYEEYGLIDSTSKTYWIEENSAQAGYENVFGKNKIKLVINFEDRKVKDTEIGIYSSENNRLNEKEYKELYDKISVKVVEENDEIKVKILIKNPKDKIFDLALRKFITGVNGNKINDRIPYLNKSSVEAWKKNNTADYYHTKEAYTVKKEDIVEYTIRVYNEGEAKGYAKEITDYLPEGLEYVSSTVDGIDYGWQVDGREIKTNYLANTLLDSCKIEEQVNNSGTNSVWYADVKLLCKVNLDLTNQFEAKYLVNRAEITKQEAEKTYLKDRDSTANNVKTEHFKDMLSYDSSKTYNSESYYPGFEDDDDYEVLKVYPVRDYEFKITKFDDLTNKKLAGAKFSITSINATNGGVAKITDVVNSQNVSILENGTTFTMPEDGMVTVKSIGNVMKSSQMEYQFKIEEIQAPENYDIVMKSFQIKVTLNVNNTKKIDIIQYIKNEGSGTRTYTGTPTGNNVRWLSLENSNNTITINVANQNKNARFDLALRKFITGIERNGNQVDITTSREPNFAINEAISSLKTSGTIDYQHTKKALEVEEGDIITYTIRVYNEGDIAGRVGEITDYLPEGLEFIENNDFNNQYGWMIDSSDKTSRTIKTNKLKDTILHENQLVNQLMGINTEIWYADVKVKCKVVKVANENTVYLTNRAEITAQEDIRGNKYGTYYNSYNNSDKDSTADTIRNSLNLANYYKQNVLSRENGEDWIHYPGVQDDDDFETVKLVSVRDYKFKLNKTSVDVNGATVTDKGDTSGKFIVKQIDENDNVIGDPLKNDEWITGTVQIDEKTNVKAGTSYRYLIEETESNADHQIIYKTIVVKITVSEDGSISPIIEKIDDQKYSDIHKKYVTIEYAEENGVLLKVANYKKRDIKVQLIKLDEKENQINARFDLTTNNQLIWDNQLITGNKEYLDEKIEYNKTYRYELKERSVEGLYNNILGDNKIQIKVKMAPNGHFTYSSGANGKKYDIVDKNGNILPTTDTLYNYVNVEFKEVDGVQTIIVKVTNESYANYKFEIHKIDKDNESEYLKDAKFTIDGPNGNIQTNDTLKQNGQAAGIFVKEENAVKRGQTYKYTIVETEPANLYQNIFDYTNINVDIVINDEGKIDNSSKVYLQITDWNRYPGVIEYMKINQFLKLEIDSDNNIAKVFIKNPKQTRDFDFSLLKTQLDMSTPVKGAKFKVQKKNDAGVYEDLKEITSTESSQLIESVKESDLNKTYYYRIEETNLPNNNYRIQIRKAEVKIEVSADGNISANIEKIQKEGSSEMVSFNKDIDGKYIQLVPNGNSFVLKMTNSISYKMILKKVDLEDNSIDLEGGEFELYKVESSPNLINKEDKEFKKSGREFYEYEANPNSTYTYYIRELKSPDAYKDDDIEYNNDFENVRIVLTLKTDANGNIIKEGTYGSKIDFESTNGQTLSSSEKAILHEKCNLNIISKNGNSSANENTIEITLKDSKKEIIPEKYNLQIIKVDKNNSRKRVEGVAFSVKMRDTSNIPDWIVYDADPDQEGKQDPVTDANGVINIRDIELTPNSTDLYQIREENVPTGYKSLRSLIIDVSVDLNGVSNATEITKDKIKISLSNWGSATTYPEDYVSCYVTANGIIQIVIPNEPTEFKFELNKLDMNGDLISAKRSTNGTLDGVDMTINSNYGFNYSGIIESGKIIDKVNCLPNTTYIYNIEENNAKIGYSNIFDDHKITLIITTDANGQILEDGVKYTVRKLPTIDNPSSYDVTSSFKEVYISSDTVWEDGIQKVTLNMKNPTGYKLKLNKVDTANNPVTVAHLEAKLGYERKCALNIYKNPATNQDMLTTGNSTATSEEMIAIKPGETQVWKVYERGVNVPYKNVFEGKYIEVTVQMSTEGILNVVNYKVKDEAGNEDVTLKMYVEKPEFMDINGIQILNITLKNPMQFKFKLTKVDADGKTQLPGAEIMVDGGAFIKDGESTAERISVTGVSAINNIYIREISTTNNHTNVFENKVIYLKLSLNKQGKFSIIDTQIGVPNNEQHTTEILDKSNEIYKYIDYDITEENGIPMINLKIMNPMKYKLRIHKTDANGNDLSGAIFDINGTRTQGEVIYEQTQDNVSVGDMGVFNIKEISTIAPYVNVLGQDKMIQIVTRLHENMRVSVVNCTIRDVNTLKEIAVMNNNNLNNVNNSNTGTIDGFPSVSLEKKIEDGITVFEVKIQNPIQYKVRLNKIKTNGEPLEGAYLQISKDGKYYGSRGQPSFEITQDDVSIGDVQDFYIYENSTKTPYVNILGENKYIHLQVKVNENKKVEVTRFQVVEKDGEKVIDIDENLVSYHITTEDGIETVNVNIKNPTQFKFELQKTDIEGNELSGAIFDINGTKTQGESVYTVENTRAELGKEYTFIIKEESVQSPYINIFKGDNCYRQLELVVVPINASALTIKVQIREISENGSKILTGSSLYNYINIQQKKYDGIPTIEVSIKNPIKYNIEIEKEDTAGNKIPGTELFVRSTYSGIYQGQEALTDENGKIEFTENGTREGTYTYFIKEIRPANERYVNILDGYYIKVDLDVRANGLIRILDKEANQLTSYYEIYKSNEDGQDILMTRENCKIYDYVSVMVEQGEDLVYSLKVKIKNPVTFKVEVNKVDSDLSELEGAKFEITSDIVKEQQAVNKDIIEKEGVEEITEEGTITGITTEEEGKIKFEETWVNEGIYEYTIQETVVPGAQYVNMLEGYLVKVRVKVNGNGSLQIVDKYDQVSPGKFYIVTKSGDEVDSETYAKLKDYVYISIQDNDLKASLGVRVENTVRYKIMVEKEDTDGNKIPGTWLSVDSDFSGMHDGQKALTDENGKVEFTENGVRRGTYTYKIKEVRPANERYVNILEGYYIKVDLDVKSDGVIRTLDDEGNKKLDYYKIYKSNADGTSTLMTKENSKIYDYVSVKVEPGEDSVYTLKVKIKNPVTFKVEVNKVDSSLESLSGAKFEITSDIVKEQQAVNKDIVEKEGIEEITKEGTITGTTTEEEGKIKFEETWVNEGIYEYTIKETKTPGAQYVNMLEGYLVKIRVKVNGNGNLQIVDKQGKVSDGKFYIIKENGEEVDSEVYEKLKDYVHISIQNNDLKASLGVLVENTVKYKVIVEKEDTEGNKIPGTWLSVDSKFSGMHNGIDNVTNVNGKIEFIEYGVREGTYTYKIKEERPANERYVNILDGYYIKVDLDVKADGIISIVDENKNITQDYYTIYKVNKDGTTTLMTRENCDIYNYISVKVEPGEDLVYTLKVKIKNPVTFNVEVNKVDSNSSKLAGAKFDVTSKIVNMQQSIHKEEIEKEGIENITSDGIITGTTTEEGRIKFEETWVNEGIYEYTIKETKTPGTQYVNMLGDYLVKVYVKVNGNGTIQIVDKDGITSDGKIYIINGNGETIEAESYNKLKSYINVNVDNSSTKANLSITIKNPVRYKITLEKEETSEKGTIANKIPGTWLSVDSTFSSMHEGESCITDVNGKVEFTEEGVNHGIYTYKIREIKVANERYVNILEGYYIEVKIEVRADGEIRIIEEREGEKYKIYKENEDGTVREIEKEEIKIKEYVEVEVEREEKGENRLKVSIKNPVKYAVKVLKQNMNGNPIDRTQISIDSTFSGKKDNLFTKVNGEISINEIGVDKGIQTYKITEVEPASDRYVNILEGHYIKINLNVNGNGVINILDNNGNINNEYFEIYKEDGSFITKEESKIYEYIKVGIITDEKGLYLLNVTIKNPITFKVELSKVDTEDGENQNVLPGANFEIESEIIKQQQGMHKEQIDKEGINGITEEGKITGTTTDKGDIKFEETWVDSGIYQYVLKEIKAPGNQYVNILEGYQVRLYVKVEANGKIRVVNENGEIGKEKFYIETEAGERVDNETYQKLAKYVHISVENNTLKAVLGLKVENPVRFKIRLHKKVLGIEDSYLARTEFELISEISGSKILTTDSEGEVEIEESFVSAGDYEYILKEKNIPNGNFANLLGSNYIKFTLNVTGDGTITQNGYEIYDLNNNLINKETSIIDKNIILDTSKKEDDISIVKIYISNPQRYNLKLIKTDIDTNSRLNKVEFKVSVFNDKGEEVTLKKASNLGQNITLDNLLTSEVNGENGVILIDDILIEKSGKYILRLQETKPYLWNQVNDIFVLININVENGQYVVKEMQVLRGTEEINNKDSKIIYDEDSTTVQIGINNERVKGKYDLELNKIDSLTKNKIDGSKFKVTIIKDGQESEVYEANNDVTSKNVILPQEVEVINGTITIKNIRIEKPESYKIKIEEIKAPDTYLDLQEVIELNVTTNLKGEGKDERFVLENVELVSGENNGLVSHKYEDNKITLTVQNEQFDLSLRKFVTKVIANEGKDNERIYDITERIPNVNVQKLKDNQSTTAEYYHAKNSMKVYAGNTIIYTIRVYNEGQVSGYAEEVVDHLPSNLEFVDDEFNKKFGWVIDETDTSLRTIKTNYLSRAKNEAENLILGFNVETQKLDYKEIQIKCKVKEDAKRKEKITNIAEISKYIGENGREVIDRDSVKPIKLPTDEDLPDYKENEIEKTYVPGQEDDDDFEKLIVEEFDLALRKFITKVNTEKVIDRVPRFKLDNGKFVYNHTKEPLLVGNENIVEYTIRVYNEGTMNGYASKIKDDIPEGLIFLPEHELNKEYRWIMLDEQGNETNEVNKAKYIVTDYLSKEQEKISGENLLKAFDSKMYESDSIKQPDYKDVKVAFKVVIPDTSDKIIINKAQITDNSDENGGGIEDIDSTPDKWIDGEDDQDIEKIRVQSFDLALRKWVTKTIIIEDGKETTKETGHKPEDNPEEVVKVELQKNKLDKTVVKFEYKIRVTNEGEIPGYVKEISDYIPEGLRFEIVDNPDWEEEEGKVVTDKLKDTLLNPGEFAEVSILLTWINKEDNMGLKVNIAEISKDYNQYETPDIDSTPNNKKDGEDDIDDAKVQLILKIGMPKTGQTRIIYILVSVAIIVICVYIVIRKKRSTRE